MGYAGVISEFPVIDVDTHVTEPPDLWTSRLPSKWVESAPHVAFDPEISEPRWRIGHQWLSPVGYYSAAGWKEPAPNHPPTLEEADPGTWNPVERLKRMDEYGIHAAVLYPNLIGFYSYAFMNAGDLDFSLACTRAYNDFITDFASVDRQRLIPIAMLPFWDLEASVTEMKRCRELGHPGVLFANKYEQIDFPPFYDAHWDPILSAAQDFEMSINFHVAFSSAKEIETRTVANQRDPREQGTRVSLGVMSNAEILATILTSDLCDRYPRLKFVSVESGFGYVPYLVELLDWLWHNYGARRDYPNLLLPSEYFRRQCYGSFWFETTTLELLELYPDNFMFETDYPHPTSLSPGPASTAEPPSVHIRNSFRHVPVEIARKVLYENAAALYKLDLGKSGRDSRQ